MDRISSLLFSCQAVYDSSRPSWTAACQAFLSFTISRSLLKLMLMELTMPSNHLILCCPLLFLPSIFPSIRVFSNESVLRIRWSKYWSFSFSISPSNEYSGLISFRIDWLDLLVVQQTVKSHFQHPSSKASVEYLCVHRYDKEPKGTWCELQSMDSGARLPCLVPASITY